MFRSGLLASCCALVLAGPVAAQDARGPAQVEDVIVTGSQVTLTAPHVGDQVARGGRVGLFGSLNVMDTPFATTNYTEQLARDQQSRSVADVLQNDPAVRLTKGFGNFQELYVIRGFPVYSDDMTYNGLYGVLPRQFVAAELFERVEVFHGASAFLNGAAPGGSGVGGAINLTPKRAPDAPLNRVTGGWASGGEIYAAADLARRFGADGAWGGRLNVAARGGEGAIEDQNSELTVLGLGVDRRGERARFSVDVGFQDHRIDAPRPQVTPAGAVPTPPDAERNFAQPWTFTDETQLFGAARGEFDLSNAVTAWAAVGGRLGEETNRLANPTAQPDGTLSAYRFDNAREDQVFAADVGLRALLTTGPVGHRLVASASRVQSRENNAYAFSNFAGFGSNLYDPVFVAPPAADFFVGGDLDAPGVVGRVRNSSVAVADMMSFLDGKISATVGMRYQDIQTRNFDYNTGAEIGAYDGDAVTPVFALLYRPIREIALYANYAEALLPGQTAPATAANRGEVLSPFRAEQAEIGMKYDVGVFGGSVSLFSLTLPSAFVNAGNIFAANGEQENRGVEVAFFGEPREGLRVLGGWTWLDAELKRTAGGALDGNRPIGVPEFQTNLNVEWDAPFAPGLTLEGRVVHTGSQPVNGANTVELDSWTRVDAGVRYAFQAGGQPVTIRARVDNIAGEDHWVAVGGFPGANYLTLGQPRAFRLSISTDF